VGLSERSARRATPVERSCRETSLSCRSVLYILHRAPVPTLPLSSVICRVSSTWRAAGEWGAFRWLGQPPLVRVPNGTTKKNRCSCSREILQLMHSKRTLGGGEYISYLGVVQGAPARVA
jgi:hypothetical protein